MIEGEGAIRYCSRIVIRLELGLNIISSDLL